MLLFPTASLFSASGPVFRGRVFFPMVLLLLIPAFLRAAEGATPGRTLDLTAQVRADIRADGSLQLTVGSRTLLSGRLNIPPADQRQRRHPVKVTSWLGRSIEGADGGLRGFSSRADDDGDGQVDEDPLDGIDNDGDGREDEDFGAISDAMTTVCLTEGANFLQLEYYHWADIRLEGAVMVSLPARGATDLLGDAYVVASGAGPWQEISLSFPRHTLSGQVEIIQGEALVSRDDGPGGSGLWLGMADLGAPFAEGVATFVPRPVLDGAHLSFGLADTRRNLAFCVAESRLQLERLLLDSARVYRGVSDPASGHQVPWIVSPACTTCRLGELPTLSWRETDQGQVALVLHVNGDGPGLMDPDLLKLNGRSLPGSITLTWHPADGPAVTEAWAASARPGRTLSVHWQSPYLEMVGLLDHGSSGQLVMTLPLTVDQLAGRLQQVKGSAVLTGLWLDGRPFSLPAPATIVRVPEPAPQVTPDEPARPVEAVEPLDGRERLVLSLKLLEGWPNPFRDVIQIRFTVPGTVQEAFDWSEKDILPDESVLQAPVQWPSGQPQASVRIYSVNGQELVTLQEGTLGDGQYTAQWNGTDAFGRKVASGTYFCKLQLDDWSVTRRIVFLR